MQLKQDHIFLIVLLLDCSKFYHATKPRHYSPQRRTGWTCQVSEHLCAGTPPTASVWLRVPHPLWAFALHPISPPTIVVLLVSRSTFLYFLFLQFPVLPVLSRTFPPRILLSMLALGPSSSVLPSSPYVCGFYHRLTIFTISNLLANSLYDNEQKT